MAPNKILTKDPLLFAVSISAQYDFYPELVSPNFQRSILPLGGAVYHQGSEPPSHKYTFFTLVVLSIATLGAIIVPSL